MLLAFGRACLLAASCLPALVVAHEFGRTGAAAQGTGALPGRWAYRAPSSQEGAKLFWAAHGDSHGDLFLICAQDGRGFHATIAARPLPEGRSVPVTASAGGRSVSIPAVAEDGPISAVGADLPSGHALLALLRSGEGQVRLRSARSEVVLTLPLAGAAAPVQRFEAACRPR